MVSNEQLSGVLDRFEAASHRCHPAFAARVRAHLVQRICQLGGPDIFELEEVEPMPVEAVETACLILDEGSSLECVLPVGEGLRIGRGRDNDLKLSGDTKVSRFHCELSRSSSGWVLVDLRSANGTLVNGELVTSQEPRRLYGGEELIIGETFLRFRRS